MSASLWVSVKGGGSCHNPNYKGNIFLATSVTKKLDHYKDNWIVWKKRSIENYERGYTIPYYGILEGNIICEATAMVHPKVVQNSDGLVGGHTVYLSAFRTIDKFQGKGYFSKLFHFMMDDLQQKGFTKATLGVEPDEEKNKEIYAHYGFTEYIKSAKEYYPDGTVIDVEYYGKTLE